MKIKLTTEQRERISAIFDNLNALSEDAKFQKMLEDANTITEEHISKMTEDEEQDYMDVLNFVENVLDTAKNNFNYWD